MTQKEILENANLLPGGEILTQGMIDLECGRASIYAYLVLIAEPRLSLYGIKVSSATLHQDTSPEHSLYELLEKETNNPYSAYNALIRKLVSLVRAIALLSSS